MSSRNNKNTKSKNNKKANFKTNKTNKNNKNNKNNKKEKFYNDSNSNDTGFTDLIDLMSVSPSAKDQDNINWKEQLKDYGILVLKYLFLVTILTLNFLGLSVSLNCNADQEFSSRVISAIFAFFFGFVYLIINYYTYKVLSQGKICKMNRDKLFPFKV